MINFPAGEFAYSPGFSRVNLRIHRVGDRRERAIRPFGGEFSAIPGRLPPKRSRITENSRSGDHDHVEFSLDGELAVGYAENSTRSENSPPKIGHTVLYFMIILIFLAASSKFHTIMAATRVNAAGGSTGGSGAGGGYCGGRRAAWMAITPAERLCQEARDQPAAVMRSARSLWAGQSLIDSAR
jgi:hypothetical protein